MELFLCSPMPRKHLGAVTGGVLLLLLPAVPWILQNADCGYEEEEAAWTLAGASGTQESGKVLSRRRRYAINPLGYKWDHVNLTYKIVQFPSTLNKADTERAIANAFRMWSDVSPLSFRRLPPTQQADITIGFYTFNHTDCWFSPLHPCFDGLNGELAHAFLPPRGEIHFDNHEFWILGRSRFSWKQGVWLNDLVQVAAHEIGHALGLWHSRDVRALMHPNATYSRTWRIGQDDVWAIQRLYGCVDEKRQCPFWAQQGFCTRQRDFMKRHCPKICNACFEHPATSTSSSPSARPSLVRLRFISKGRVITFRCGLNSSASHLQVSWYKDGEPLSHSLPGFELLPSQDLRVVATEFSEGRYACLIRHGGTTLRINSWQVKLKAKSSLHPLLGLPKDTHGSTLTEAAP
ncbi:matrix metalloproteinase-23-like [Eublepharis macularius]|uniref:Matrix metalloproteinase-23-like n=1 Tax=Eublepharis macularius TaxID=481883 RepID=A0AA97JHW3_EUBMA|nr:matrix metalloproteinase-23-like [Eublepharis macularius]